MKSKIRLLINRIIFISFILSLFSFDTLAQQDEKTFYSKTFIVVFKDSKTNEFAFEKVLGKNLTISYDEIFKSIRILFTTEDGNESQKRLSFLDYSKKPGTNEYIYEEMIMVDKLGYKYYVRFDPINNKSLYMWPYGNPEVNGFNYHNVIKNITTIKNW